MYSSPLEAAFPLNLAQQLPLPEGATFKALSIDAFHVHYAFDRMVEHQFPSDMRSFNRCSGKAHLSDIPEGSVAFIGGAWFDDVADSIDGLVPAVDFRLVYDPATGIVDGQVIPVQAPAADGETLGPSPVTFIDIGYCLQYYPPDA